MEMLHEKFVKPLREDIEHVSLDMAINGLDIDHYECLNMESSPGFPYVKDRRSGDKGKKFLFTQLHNDGERTNYKAKPMLVNDIVKRLLTMLKRILPFTVWVHCLKDERRMMKKIWEMATRIFTMGPVDLTLLGRMLTMDFVAAYMAAKGNFYSMVGIDISSPEWTKLYNRLRSVGIKGGDGDYSKYDGILDPDLMYAAMRLIAKWYDKYAPHGTYLDFYGHEIFITSKQRSFILHLFAVEFVHSIQLVLDILHQKAQGNPSGNWLTVILNTIVGEFLLILSFLDIAQDTGRYEYFSVEAYLENIRDAIFGDDNMFCATPAVLEWFNPLSLSVKLAEYGITYTTADKSGADQSEKSVDDLRFLKCGFRPHEKYPEKKMANIDTDSIFELTNWIRECPDELEQTRVQLHEALRFSYYHGKMFYDEMRVRINDAIDQAGVDIQKFGDEYELLDAVFLSKFF